MSKRIKILLSLLVVGIALYFFYNVSSFVYEIIKNGDLKYDAKTECIEDGNCKEGLSIKVGNNKLIVINKDTCIENNGKWYEDSKLCRFNH